MKKLKLFVLKAGRTVATSLPYGKVTRFLIFYKKVTSSPIGINVIVVLNHHKRIMSTLLPQSTPFYLTTSVKTDVLIIL